LRNYIFKNKNDPDIYLPVNISRLINNAKNYKLIRHDESSDLSPKECIEE